MSVFITSDTHFFHANIIKYCNRPFANPEEMNAVLVKNWNAKVDPHDEVYHLGDFALSTPQQAEKIREQLNGNIFLVKGNHEHAALQAKQCFAWIRDVYELRVGKQALWLSHYAHRVWNKSHHGVWHLYGHSHGTLPDDPNSMSFDAGVDCHNYSPLSMEEIAAIMAKKTFKPKDHHGESH
jgi:calcineurin-like phosphoesterase family protein